MSKQPFTRLAGAAALSIALLGLPACKQGAKSTLIESALAPVTSGDGNGNGSGGDSNGDLGGKRARIQWAANKESAVNRAGGGYRVYVGRTAGFALAGAERVFNVPYVSGSAAPTSTVISGLSAATTYYVKVVAYSAVSATGSGSSASDASAETTLVVP